MKISAAVLILGMVLTAALPAAADEIYHTGVRGDFSGVLLTDRIDGDKNFNAWDSRSFLVANAFFSDLRDDKFRRDGLIDWNFFARGSSVLPVWKGWSVEEQGRDWNNGGQKEDLGAMSVPEPASLSFLLLGLATVGFLRPRRTAWERPI